MRQLGVIIGRFQTSHLHPGHEHLIESVRHVSDREIILLGCTGGQATETDPLDFEVRYDMLHKQYPAAIIEPIYDCPSDVKWTHQLDRIIERLKHDNEYVTLYGARDSFISHYSGKFETEEVTTLSDYSATQIRNSIKRPGNFAHLFREGMIYAANNRYPTSYQAIDIAILDEEGNVLLGKKDGDEKLRFVGGFVDPVDHSLEVTACREAQEETGCIIEKAIYIGSARIDDHRYRKSNDGIMTAFFYGFHHSGTPAAADDLASVEWVPLDRVKEVIQEGHVGLAEMLADHFNI